MFDAKVIDYAAKAAEGTTSSVSRGRIEVVEDQSAEPAHDGVWVTLEIRSPETHSLGDSQDKITLSEVDIKLVLRAPHDSEADWILDGAEPLGLSDADV